MEQVSAPQVKKTYIKIECACGRSYNHNQLKKHLSTKSHTVFVETGQQRVSKVDPSYPIGDNRRYYPAVKEAMTKYNKKKQLDRLSKKIERLYESLEKFNLEIQESQE